MLARIVGALCAQSTMLPFILIESVGMNPAEFGVGMLMQTGSFFFGSVALRILSPCLGERRVLLTGLTLAGTGGACIAVSVAIVEPTFLSIMMPVAMCAFGMAFVIPYITTAGLQPHPAIAGSAAALIGFVQMGSGFLGGLAGALIGDPLRAFGMVIPAMELITILAYVGFRQTNRRMT